MSNRKVILCFIEFYSPGYKSGGPIRSIENFISLFSKEFDIKIVCRDRDLLDKSPYSNVKINLWNEVGGAQVFYASDNALSFMGIIRLLRETQYDLLYLNSFFCYRFTILPLLARWFGFVKAKTCIIAPRGELSKGALQIKSIKKTAYLFFSRLFGLYKNLLWQVSSEMESKDVSQRRVAGAAKIMVAPDLLKMTVVDEFASHPASQSGGLRVIFISRISPIKNLDFLLITLSSIHVNIKLDIYGPLEDEVYWEYCEELISDMPKNINVNFYGGVKHNEVQEIFLRYDLFAFPTKGENFGHVIFESLSAGTPVMVSDKTSWQSSLNNGLMALPLDQSVWRKAIIERSSCSVARLSEIRKDALSIASSYLNSDQSIQKNRELLFTALGNIR